MVTQTHPFTTSRTQGGNEVNIARGSL